MSEVYVVLSTCIDGDPQAVFSTEEKAQAYVTANPDFNAGDSRSFYLPFDRIKCFVIDRVDEDLL